MLDVGEFFGEGALAGQPLRLATATALVPSRIRVVPKRQMIRLLRQERTLSDRFIAHMLARNLRLEEDLVGEDVYLFQRFPESCGHSGHQPSPKHHSGGLMGSFDPSHKPERRPTPSTFVGNVPAACPTCRSASIVTAAKTLDASAYWRCTECGDVWNDSRYHEDHGRARRWR